MKEALQVATLVVFGIASSGCILDNLLYGDATGGTDASGATTTLATTSASATTTTGAGTSSAGSSTSGGTSGASSGSTGEGTSSGSTGALTTTTTTTTGADTSGGEPEDCWGMPIDAWTWAEILDGNLGAGPRTPRISPDGYTLYYTAGEPGRPFASVRASLDAPFVDGQTMVAWGNIEGNDHVALRELAGEMILSGKAMVGQADVDVLVATKGNAWAAPKALGGVKSALAERSPTLSEDGSRLVFERLTDKVNPVLGKVWGFFEGKRAAYPAAGTPFSAVAPLVIQGVTNDPGYVHAFLCAALSPDGLRLFFGSSYPDAIDPNDHTDALRISYVERATIDAPWDPATLTRLDTLFEAGWQSCPYAITRDGCQLSFGRFFFTLNEEPAPVDKVRNFLATRG